MKGRDRLRASRPGPPQGRVLVLGGDTRAFLAVVRSLGRRALCEGLVPDGLVPEL